MSENDIMVTVYICPSCGCITTGKDTPEWYWHKMSHFSAGNPVESYYPIEGKVSLADVPKLAKPKMAKMYCEAQSERR